jgi:alpha-1,3-rhamnosyl/mannosyltransferase
MKVGVDLTAQDRYPFSGIAKTNQILYDFVSTARPDWTFCGFHRPGVPTATFVANRPNVNERVAHMHGWRLFPNSDAWLEVALPLRALLSRCDVLHCPGNAVPSRSFVPLIASILDLIPLHFYGDREDVRQWADQMPERLSRCRRIVVPSAYVRGQLLSWLPSLSDRVVMIHLAPSTAPVERPSDTTSSTSASGLAPGTSYVVALGSALPHKNTRRLVEAWCAIPDRVSRAHVLLIVGLPAALRTEFEQLARSCGRSSSCVFRDIVPEAELPGLIGGATAICYPSLSEGFGLPVLDGFACGTAVTASNVASIPEVGGNAVDYFDPHSPQSIRDSICRVLSDSSWRAELIARGRERLKQFSWTRTAAAFADVVGAAAG